MTRTATALVAGGGPAGLMAADMLARDGVAVTLIEQMPTVGRKFLMAGRGGLNLTHSEPLDRFVTRYGAAAGRIAPLLDEFAPQALRDFAAELGQETFVGSSGRIFPRAMKASPMLRAWLQRLRRLGVVFRTRTRFERFEGANVVISGARGDETLTPDVVVLALGGASWPKLGSDGTWTAPLAAAGIALAPFSPSNAGLLIDWSSFLHQRFAGKPLKRITASFGAATAHGDVVVTRRGLEGGPIYALSPLLREAIANGADALLEIDLRPDVSSEALADRLSRRRSGDSLANALRKAAGLSPEAIAVLREAGPPPTNPSALARAIKATRLRVSGVSGLDRAISSAGGVRLEQLDDRLMARDRPGLFIAGEMLDWEAPTGGYLLQACFASGYVAGQAAAQYALRQARSDP